MWNLTYCDIYWEGDRAVHLQWSKFLDYLRDNFLAIEGNKQMGGAPLDLLLTNRKELVQNLKVKGNLEDSNPEMI